MGSFKDFKVRLFEGGDLGDIDVIQMSSDSGVDDGDLIGGSHGYVLSLRRGNEVHSIQFLVVSHKGGEWGPVGPSRSFSTGRDYTASNACRIRYIQLDLVITVQ